MKTHKYEQNEAGSIKLAFQLIALGTVSTLALLLWITYMAIFMAPVSAHGAEDNWFIAPVISQVYPLNSAIEYHGMSGTVSYKDGGNYGLDLGRNIGPFKIYGEYTFSQFRDRAISLATPYGTVVDGDNSYLRQNTVSLNADYTHLLPFGWRAVIGGGVGAGFDSTTSCVLGLRAGLERTLSGGWTLGGFYEYLWTDGQIKEGLKSDGSYSIVTDEPREQRLTLKLERGF